MDLGFAGALGALSDAEVDVAGVRVPVHLLREAFGFSLLFTFGFRVRGSAFRFENVERLEHLC